ncbi:MAG: hypothetical protein ACK5MD_01020 [Flavobacteriales bacterium]
MFETYLEIQKDKLATEKLNLDGTHSLVKKSAQSTAYQHRKRGRASNILIRTDGKGIPSASGGIISGNHNDLFQIVPQYAQMIKDLKTRETRIKEYLYQNTIPVVGLREGSWLEVKNNQVYLRGPFSARIFESLEKIYELEPNTIVSF